jgi:hypothetical protein
VWRPAFDPGVYTVSVTAFVDDPSFQTSSVSALSIPPAPRPAEVAADRLFSSLSKVRKHEPDRVDLALWVQQDEKAQAEQLRAALDAQLFASSDEPGTGAWGLAAFGGFAALKAKPEEGDKNEETRKPQPPSK